MSRQGSINDPINMGQIPIELYLLEKVIIQQFNVIQASNFVTKVYDTEQVCKETTFITLINILINNMFIKL